MNRAALIAFVTIFLFTSCKKDHHITPLASGVYAAGASGSGAPYNSYVATIWKNGVEEKLSTVAAGGGTFATGIAIHGSDIYVVGDSVYNGTQYSAAYLWKNGVRTILAGGTQANGIAVNGNDIYIVGQDQSGHPCYWKNGVETMIGTVYGTARAILFNGTDMYVAGDAINPTYNRDLAACWKDGINIPLFDTSYMSAATSLAIIGNDVYAGGYFISFDSITDVGCYWKNGQEFSLPSPLQDGHAGQVTGTATDGANIYFAGDYQNAAVADTFEASSWKNGIPMILQSSGVINSEALGMSYYNGDLYVLGYIASPNFIFGENAAYWKNGVVVPVSSDNPSWVTALSFVP